MAAKVATLAKAGWKTHVAKWVYNVSDFRKYGLYSQDTVDEWQPDVARALKQLPEDVYNARLFRITRALQLSNCKIKLPQEEWTHFEDDQNMRYLDGVIEEVRREMAEEKEWATKA